MSNVQPKLTGTFAKTPLLHVMASLLEQAAGGTLVIETKDGTRSALVVERGVPVKMRLGQPAMRLGEILVDLGWIRREICQASFDKAVPLGRLHGAVLVEEGHIEAATLELALRSQLVKKLQWAAALPADTVFGFYDAVDYLSKWRAGSTPVGPLVAIWTLARSRAEASVVATVVSRVAGHPLRLHQKSHLKSFGFDRTELTLLDVLRARPQTLDGLLRMGLVSPHTLERIIYTLTLTRHLDFGRGLVPLGVDAVSEREERLLLPKESLRPSRPVVLSAMTSPEESLRIDTDGPAQIERLDIESPKIALGDRGTPIPTALTNAAPAPATQARADAERATVATNASTAAPLQTPAGTHVSAGIRAGSDQSNSAPRESQSGASRPPSGTRRASSPPPGMAAVRPSVMPATTTDRRTQLERLAVTMTQLSHFEVLGLPRDATAATVQDTYLKLAKVYHPDRLSPDLADLKSLATKIFARMSEAHQILTDASRRAQYLQQLDHGPLEDEDEKVRKVLRAAGAFQKAEVLFKKRMLAAAELEANRALEDDPEQADYLALYAWIQACKPDSEPRLTELCNLLTEALKRNPNSEKNRYYRVQLYKRLGQVDKAVADCRIIVDKNPHHVDALREIRLWDMRRSAQKQTATPGQRASGNRTPSDPPRPGQPSGKKSDPPQPPGGLLGRLFKR